MILVMASIGVLKRRWGWRWRNPRRPSMALVPENQVRTGLPAGGSRIRTIGPRVMYAFGIGSGRFTRASGKVGVNENDGTRRSRGTDGSNPVPSCGESANLD